MSEVPTLRNLAATKAKQYGESVFDSWMRIAEWLEGEGLPSDPDSIERFCGLLNEELDK